MPPQAAIESGMVFEASCQESLDLRRTHLAGIRHGAVAAMLANEKPHPVQVNLLSGEAIVQAANPLPHLVKQTDRLQRRAAGFHSCIYTCIK